MGAVIEVIWHALRRIPEEIFDPLGMEDTGFWIPEEKRGRFAQVYRPEDGLAPYTDAHLCILPTYPHEPAFQSAAARACSTIEDYAKFASMLANEGEWNGVRILSRRTVRYEPEPADR